jgi:hypothetical protein
MKEYLKTAAAITKHPWRMDQASMYLNALAHRQSHPPDIESMPSMDFVKHGVRHFETLLPHDGEDVYHYAPGTPRMVELQVTAKRQRMSQKTKVTSGAFAKAAAAEARKLTSAARALDAAAAQAGAAAAAAPAVIPAPAAAQAAAPPAAAAAAPIEQPALNRAALLVVARAAATALGGPVGLCQVQTKSEWLCTVLQESNSSSSRGCSGS